MTTAAPSIAVVGFLIIAFSVGRIALLRKCHYSQRRVFAEAFGLIAVALAALGTVIFSCADAIAFQDQAPPGSIYVVDGHRMRIYCEGRGAPTIILDAGLGNDGLIWSGVQPLLAKTTRACSFDRAGYGWSDPVNTSRDADHASLELHGLLMAAGIRDPIILAGHSIAGLYARDYAARYPEDVAGIIFIDASVPLRDEVSTAKDLQPKSRASPERLLEAVIFSLGFNHLLGACPGSLPGFRLYLKEPRLEGVCREHLSAFLGERDAMDLSGEEAAAFRASKLPILILSRWTTDESWNRQQESLRNLSSKSRRIIAADSGHYIQVDRPALFKKEISYFVRQVREKAPELIRPESTRIE